MVFHVVLFYRPHDHDDVPKLKEVKHTILLAIPDIRAWDAAHQPAEALTPDHRQSSAAFLVLLCVVKAYGSIVLSFREHQGDGIAKEHLILEGAILWSWEPNKGGWVYRVFPYQTPVLGCDFSAYNWKLPAYSGACLLAVHNLSFFYLQLELSCYNFSFFAYNWSFFAYSGKSRLIRALSDCKQTGFTSEAWGPPQFQEKRSSSEKAVLGALGEFRGILGAALGIRNSILGIRNSILGMAFHDLSNTKTTILGATK